jgi:uncharacterized membrane protein
MESESNRDHLAHFRELGLLAVVAAYFATPLLSFANADHLMSCGLAMAAAMMFALIITKPHQARKISYALLVAAAVWTGVVFHKASLDYTENQNRCLMIETDLLTARAIPNGADLFQAFRCVPQPRRVALALPKK